jgi:hypothetical protein
MRFANENRGPRLLGGNEKPMVCPFAVTAARPRGVGVGSQEVTHDQH